MGLFFFYNQKKPRGFNHKPIYYDPRKEALDERVQKVKREIGEPIDDAEYKPNLKGAFRNETEHLNRKDENPHKYSSAMSIRLGVALVLLVVLMYYLYFM